MRSFSNPRPRTTSNRRQDRPAQASPERENPPTHTLDPGYDIPTKTHPDLQKPTKKGRPAAAERPTHPPTRQPTQIADNDCHCPHGTCQSYQSYLAGNVVIDPTTSTGSPIIAVS